MDSINDIFYDRDKLIPGLEIYHANVTFGKNHKAKSVQLPQKFKVISYNKYKESYFNYGDLILKNEEETRHIVGWLGMLAEEESLIKEAWNKVLDEESEKLIDLMINIEKLKI